MTADTRLLRWPEQDREDYERLAVALQRVRAGAARTRGELSPAVPLGPEEPSDLDRARALLAQRRARDAAAGVHADLFGEGGWDLLLTLFIAFEEGRRIGIDDAVANVGLHAAVARRWLTVLVERDLIVRLDQATVSLTDVGMALVLRCISES